MLAPALTILLSSFLLFLVQPIVAKQIVPWFGGSAGVWTICLLFFQLVLLLGYAYSHWLTRHLAASRRLTLHILLLVLSCLSLPIIPGYYWKPDQGIEPSWQILGLLGATIGLPYFLLASTAPLLQKWLSDRAKENTQQRSIYRLFALSNLGSLCGLLSYPFAIEPFASVHAQAWVWSSAYGLFVVSFIIYAWKRRSQPALADARTDAGMPSEVPPSFARYLYWIGCAALGTALLLSVTNQITQNVASIPFLWIVPLSLYLLSFVVCFEGRSGLGWYERRFWMTPTMLAAGAIAWALFADDANLSVYTALPIYIIGLFFGCIVCHGELARSKPNSYYLTHFYLSLAAGGAFGGLLVGLVAPRIFNNYWEMPLAVICLAALGVFAWRDEALVSSRRSWAVCVLTAFFGAALILLLLGGLPSSLADYAPGWDKIVKGDARWGCALLLIVSAFLLQKYRLARSVALATLICTLAFGLDYYRGFSSGMEFAVRNFYGSLRVIDSPYGADRIRRLKHGVVVHGSQIMGSARRETPTTYYGETSGIGRTMTAEHSAIGTLRIGSIGLGTGTLAVYGRPGDLFRAYELNPAILDIAERRFTYLRDSTAHVESVLGDARLTLERQIAQGLFDAPEQRYDVLSLDAFSGDAIPVHLLTREAFATYSHAVKPDGVIAFHLSNNYLDLPPVVARIAQDAGFQAVLVLDRPADSGLTAPSCWVLVTKNAAFLQRPEIAPYSTAIAVPPGRRIWSDQFSNLFQILK